MRAIFILVGLALFLTVGLPFWADLSTTAAVEAWKLGLIRQAYAPQLGVGLTYAPIWVLLAAAAGYWLPRLIKQAMQ